MLGRSCIMVSMNRLSTEIRVQVVASLVEGNSIRATCRMTGVAKNTVVKLLTELGEACQWYQDEHLRNLPCKRVQCDEVWSFCYSKDKNVPEQHKGEFGYGDVWTWTALCADTKLVPCWLVGRHTGADARAFISDLSDRLANRVQLTTDGYRAYLGAVEEAFGADIDYAILDKMYGPEPEGERRYSCADCVGTKRRIVMGKPNPKDISTSYIERQNLTMRMGMRRFTRLTNAFSKKVENLMHAVSLHFMYYNFARVHKSIGTSPAKAAGVADHVWSLHEIVALLDSN